jgi:DNA primase
MGSVFEQIKDRLTITDVLSTYITVIQSGSNYKAKCPFHNERSASFSISPERGLYYCFGCGAKGDIFTFVEQFEGVDKKGALKILADRAGVVLSREYVQRESTDALYDILESTTTRYQHELARHPDVLSYLYGRGLTDVTIALFRIGYVPDEWRYVANVVKDEAGAAIAERAGLIKKTEKGYYDRFRKRVMFPLTDASGRVVGFSGRLYPADTEGDKQSPKYLNSPETELFQKSRILFGFDKAKAAIRQHGFAILVEGQMDCVLAQQAGFRNTVATSGTAVSEQAASDSTANLVVLSRLTPHVFLAFDGDAAGQKALDHAAIVALGLGMNPKVVPLPQGVDPADYIKEHGADGWKALLKQSKHFILHQLAHINRHDVSAHVLVQKLKDRIFPFLVRIVSPIEQATYIESIAKELDLSKDSIIRELDFFVAAKPVEQVVIPVVQTADTISIADRFFGLVKRYPTTVATTLHQALSSLSFQEHHFSLPVVSEERMTQLLALAERDYGALADTERDALLRELAHKLTEQFLSDVRTTLTRALEVSEKEGNETRSQMILATLHTLNQRRHMET